jgi:PAS domain S-box-containing protein
MQDSLKTKEELLAELAELRGRIAELAESEAEHTRTEEKLRESENRFRAIADYTCDWESWVDPNGKLLWINPAILRISGYTVDECMAMPDFPMPLIEEKDKGRIARLFGEAVHSSSGDDVEFRLRCKDGSLKWAAVSWQPICDVNGSCLGHRSSVRDITDRKQAEEALRKSEARFRQFVEQVPLPLCFVNKEGVLIYFNDRFVKMFGYTHGDVPTLREWWKLAYPDEEYRRRVIDTWNAAVKKAADIAGDIEPMEYNVTCNDGTVRNVVISGITMEDSYLATFIDITGRKRAEEALKRSEGRLSGIIEFFPDAILAVDLEGKIIAWNKAIEEMTGVPAATMLGKGDYEYAVPLYGERRPMLVDFLFLWDDDIAKKYSFIKKDGDTLYTETDMPFVRGRNRTLWAKASPLRNERGDVVGAIESIRDITERKRAEVDLRAAKDYIENLIRSANVLIVGLDADSNVTLLNEAGEKMTGYKADEIVGKNWFEVVVPKELYPQVWDEFNQLKNAGAVTDTFENPIRTKSGEERIISWKNSTLKQDGKFIGTISFGMDITDRKRAQEEREKLIVELRGALNKVKTLSGLLPICASCKKIRNDKGYWEQIEVYIRDHSEAAFSHGICPDCAKRLYPEYYKKK